MAARGGLKSCDVVRKKSLACAGLLPRLEGNAPRPNSIERESDEQQQLAANKFQSGDEKSRNQFMNAFPGKQSGQADCRLCGFSNQLRQFERTKIYIEPRIQEKLVTSKTEVDGNRKGGFVVTQRQ